MSLLKAEPAEIIASLPELVAVARAMEEEAVARYRALAARMREIGAEAVRRVFEDLAEEEEGHVGAVTRWSNERVGREPDPADIRWRGWSETFDEEDLGRSRLVTPYSALSVAVRNEERAFAFWSYVSAHAERAEVRAGAERMALEELGHLRVLRAARRRAFHEARGTSPRRRERLRSDSPAAFAEDAARLEAALAALHGAGADALRPGDAEGAAVLAELAAQEAAEAGRLAAGAPSGGETPPTPEARAALLDQALERLEQALELYFEAAERSADEAVVAEAQRLAEGAVRRLARLRELREG